MGKMLAGLFLLVVLLCSSALAQIDVQNTQFSNNRFTARIRISPDQEPVYIILDQLIIGGLPFDETGSYISNTWVGYPHGTEMKSLIGEFFVQLEEGYMQSPIQSRAAAFESLTHQLAQTDPVSVSFRITLLSPKKEAVEVDCEFTGDSTDTWKQIDEIITRGCTPVESSEPHTVLVSSAVLDEVRYDEPIVSPLGDVEALTKCANMIVVEQRRFELYGSSVIDACN